MRTARMRPKRPRVRFFSGRGGCSDEKKANFARWMLRFDVSLRLTSTMKEIEFTARVLPLRDRMFRYAQSLLLSSAEAEDAVHDLLERLWRDRERLSPSRSIDSFVMASVRNRCYDLLRKRMADERRNDAAVLLGDRSSPGEAERWEVRELVRRAMSCLPERQREALHLKDIEGYPTVEIAALLGCDEAQVRVILSRARHTIRGILEKMMSDERTRRTE